MRVYLSAKFEAQDRMRELRITIRQMGHLVVSSWLDENPSEAILGDPCREFAERDTDDLWSANLFIIDTYDNNERGGREVELGMALAIQDASPTTMKVWQVGYQRNVFHYAEGVRHFDYWKDALKELEKYGNDAKAINDQSPSEHFTLA